MGGGRLPSGGRARRSPFAAAAAAAAAAPGAAALTAVVATAASAAATAAARTPDASASWWPLPMSLVPPPGARWHVARAASLAARRLPGPLGGRPAPPRPALARRVPRPAPA
jgi:hypothetical protein